MGVAVGMLAEGREHVGWWSVVVVEELEKAWPNFCFCFWNTLSGAERLIPGSDAQGSLSVKLGGPYVVLGSNPNWRCARQASALPVVLSLWPLVVLV